MHGALLYARLHYRMVDAVSGSPAMPYCLCVVVVLQDPSTVELLRASLQWLPIVHCCGLLWVAVGCCGLLWVVDGMLRKRA